MLDIKLISKRVCEIFFFQLKRLERIRKKYLQIFKYSKEKNIQ